MEIIRSKENRLTKIIKSLSSKKGREDNKLFILEGPKVVLEAMDSDFEIFAICLREDIYEKAVLDDLNYSWLNNEILLFENGDSKFKVCVIQKDIFDILSLTENSQGVMSLIKIKNDKEVIREIEALMESDFCFIVLDEIKDPGNMGTIIRTAEAFGIEGIIVGKGSVDVFNDKVIRSTMGSILRMPVLQIENLKVFLLDLKGKGVQIIGADPHSETDFRKVEKAAKTVIVIGNEAKGISEDIRECLSIAVNIPMSGRAESLNAGIAAALMAYEFNSQEYVKLKIIDKKQKEE